VRRKCDGTDNVVMLEGVGNFARMGVPYFGGEICRSCSSILRIRRESSLVDSAFMSEKGANPISGDAITEHRIIVLASRDHVVFAFWADRREVDVRNGS